MAAVAECVARSLHGVAGGAERDAQTTAGRARRLAENPSSRCRGERRARLSMSANAGAVELASPRITALAAAGPQRDPRAGTGRPRIARTCSANSERSWLASVTMPVSCGRGETSEKITSSPATKSSTPKIPWPPSAVGHGAGDLLALGQDRSDRPRRAASSRGSRRPPGGGRSARRTRCRRRGGRSAA